MQATEQINHYLRHLATLLELPLELDEFGVCAVEDSEGMRWVVEVPGDFDTVVLLAPIMDLAVEEPAWFFRRLLSSHLNLRQLQGAYFAVDERKARLLLCISRTVSSLTPEMFESLFFNFMELSLDVTSSVQEWHEHESFSEGDHSQLDGPLFFEKV